MPYGVLPPSKKDDRSWGVIGAVRNDKLDWLKI